MPQYSYPCACCGPSTNCYCNPDGNSTGYVQSWSFKFSNVIPGPPPDCNFCTALNGLHICMSQSCTACKGKLILGCCFIGSYNGTNIGCNAALVFPILLTIKPDGSAILTVSGAFGAPVFLTFEATNWNCTGPSVMTLTSSGPQTGCTINDTSITLYPCNTLDGGCPQQTNVQYCAGSYSNPALPCIP